MYRAFYGLKHKPFQISSDPTFLWLGPQHKEALAILVYGIQNNKGFLLLTGGVGTGKTTLIHALLDRLEDDVKVASVPDPGLQPMDFYNFIALSFGMPGRYKSKVEFLFDFDYFLRKMRSSGKRVLLIIDEAQRLNSRQLEEIRLLSNIETPQQKLLNIFFVGQEELLTTLAAPANRALKQRITLNYNIDLLDLEATRALIRHRLNVAGCVKEVFDPSAILGVHALSHGSPRRINIICDHALLAGYVAQKEVIDADIIQECFLDLLLPGEAAPDQAATPSPPPEPVAAHATSAPAILGEAILAAPPPAPKRRYGHTWAYAAGLVAALLIGIFYFQTEPPDPTVVAGNNRPLPAVADRGQIEPARREMPGIVSSIPKEAAAAPPEESDVLPVEIETDAEPAVSADGAKRLTDRDVDPARDQHPSVSRTVAVPAGPAELGTETVSVDSHDSRPSTASGKDMKSLRPQATEAEKPPSPDAQKPASRRMRAAKNSPPQASTVTNNAATPTTGVKPTRARPAPSPEPVRPTRRTVPAQEIPTLPEPPVTIVNRQPASQPSALEPKRPLASEILPPQGARSETRTGSAGIATESPLLPDRLQTFLKTYCQVYSARDLDRFTALFEADATERGHSFATLIPTYRKNFEQLAGVDYQIEMQEYSENPNGRELQVKGRFKLHYHLEGQDWKTSRGAITMGLVKDDQTFRVKHLDYRKQ